MTLFLSSSGPGDFPGIDQSLHNLGPNVQLITLNTEGKAWGGNKMFSSAFAQRILSVKDQKFINLLTIT